MINVLLPETFWRESLSRFEESGHDQPNSDLYPLYKKLQATSRKVSLTESELSELKYHANIMIDIWYDVLDQNPSSLRDYEKVLKREATSAKLFLDKVRIQ